jgi:hypothetical protein
MFNPSKDLVSIQDALMKDTTILSLMDLTGDALTKRVNDYIAENPDATLESASEIIISESIIKSSQWSDLAKGEERLCVYFAPSRRTANEDLSEEILEVDCHVPAVIGYKANKIIGRTVDLLNRKSIQGRYLKYYGYLGELSTMPDFYCCGCRFNFYNPL